MHCTWDPHKNQINIAKHGLDFTDAARLFDLPDHLILEEFDETPNEASEDRIRSIGPIAQGTIIVVSVDREDGETIHLISARFATPLERRRYANLIAGV